MFLFQKATYAFSVANPGDALPESQGEIAFAGRSNAGKSSAINTLAGRRRLAFVSKTPGRTQMINFFSLGAGKYLVDLPGYGYAKAPGAVREQWGLLTAAYLRERTELCGMVLIMDIRHPFTELDERLIEFVSTLELPVHILLSKCDKVSRAQSASVLGEARDRLTGGWARHSVQLFSSLRRIGVDDAEQRIATMLGMEYSRRDRPPVARRREDAQKPARTGGTKMNPRAKGG